ncbi:MAG TPA: DUF1134 domain-containing protein [Candidatus Methylomirabilis sp.]|nr:DUF1134 domain-containing protein [Candidatus Methylomirabilis sp.]
MRKAVLLTAFGLSLLSLGSCTSSTPTSSAPPPGTPMAVAQADTGTVSVESKSIAIGVGVSWGDGVLQYRGGTYAFTIDGLSVLDLGVSRVSATGNVANLKRLEDFNGNYALAGAGAVVGGGAGAAVMRNQNGVEIALTATAQGVRFSLPSSGVNIKLKQ